ncbi:integrin beta-5 isoform X2 [Lontra canadensis]|uniref:integrin beta-5 isoform X2 n=1 Tax=Lontra canadensis TaxID=76717 RepID=UPI0013F39C4C|nr:integrin beta-5 isoform X2 [Lontra canadensis]
MPRAPAPLYACLLGLCSLVPSLPGLNICTSGSATSCEECLLIHPKCAWCFKEDFGSLRSVISRCDLKANLARNGCGGEFESPASSTQVLRSLPLSSKGSSPTSSDVIQMTPQKIALNLRPGDKTTFQLQVRQVEDYPVDLYYLMDLSLSMKDDLDNIRNLGTKLAEEMRKLTSNFRLGFGSFVDKNISPFSYTAPRYQNNPCIGYKLFPNCVPSFGFRHLLPLTDRVDSFNEEVRKQRVSRNRDAPEGGFDAVLQAAVCKEKIGWRKDALHLLVFTTDDVPHIALDGKLGGLVQPHDGQCHLNEANEYTVSNQMDYPSLALLGEKLAENNINLIFAVTKSHYMLYKNFTALIPGTTVEILHGDSKNIIQLIINAYNSIRSKVEVSVWDQPEDLNLFFTATCQDGVSYPGQRKCEGLKIGDTASFEVSAEARSCPSRPTEHTFTLRPVGFRDSLEVGVTYSCQCGCSARLESDSTRCSGNGTYVCGLCECNPGHLGTRCECQEGESQTGYQNLCREAEGKPLCSGRGECSCNQCSCFESEFGKIYGSFCQCDNFSCARNRGVLCSVKDDQEAVLCFYKTAKDCVMMFTYAELASGKSNLTVLREPECGTAPDATTILLAVVGSILLIGIALLAIWKLLVTIHDRREFAKFQSERSRARYEMASNPLYRKPISTHTVDFTFNKFNKSYNGTVD